MSVQPSSSPVLSDDLVVAISRAYADSDAALASRVRVIRRALAAGFTVKSIAAGMAEAAEREPSLTAVTATIYGYAAAASWAIDATGADVKGLSSDQLATLARAAKHVGVGPFKTGVRTVLAPLGDDVDKFAAVLTMALDALDNVRPDRARAKTRAAHSQGGMGSGDTDAADVPNNEHVHPAPGKPDAAETLAALRRATKYLAQGGDVDPILASAIAEFVAAAASAQRRTVRTPVAA
ncbi:hypothetical protein SEA_FIZZLES_104 [Microbacterium phage Fizzles]|nr:hypothetical protein SEA_FIZZLES_104 [Microbacterium phage Fizzles]